MTNWQTKFLYTSFVVAMVLIPSAFLYAQGGYVQLVGVPGIPGGGNNLGTTEQYVNALYNLSIGVAALLAVVKIIFAGAKYIFTDVVTTKGDAKKDIQNAIIGLLIVLAAVLILQTINRQLVNFDALSNLETTTVELTTTLPPRTESVRNTICSQEGGCTRLVCGNGAAWRDLGLPTGADNCELNCNTIGGSVLMMERDNIFGARRECVVSALTLESMTSADSPGVMRALRGLETLCNMPGEPTCQTIESACLNQPNIISISQRTNVRECIFSSTFDPNNISVSPDPEVTYTIAQNLDQIAAGEAPVIIIVIPNSYNNGFVNVTLPSGEEQQITCNNIIPAVCS